MTKVTAILSDGTEKVVACPGVKPEDVTVSFIDKRTDFDENVDSVSVEMDVTDRLDDLEAATGTGQPAESGIAQRIDDLESRVSDLEGFH